MTSAEPGQYAWHVHHEKLFEKLTEPLQNRIDYIKKDKPSNEQALRLKLMRPVKDQQKLASILGDATLAQAWPAYDKALQDAIEAHRKEAGSKAYKVATETANQVYNRVHAAAMKRGSAIATLHKKECEPDCPWDGKTIFPGRYSS